MHLLLAAACATRSTPAPQAAPAPSPVAQPDAHPMMTVDGGLIEVAPPPDLVDPQRTEVLDSIRASAGAVGGWYRGFPVPTLRIDLSFTGGDSVDFATTWPGMPPHIDLPVGRDAHTAAFDRDWVLVHEMTHLAFPPVDDRHHWVEEGLATYLEPWERVAAGRLTPELAWHDFVRDLPQGVPGPGDPGLDHSGAWAATYWGGALFCFLADLEIRERTDNRVGLREAVIAIAKTGGMTTGRRDLAEVLGLGDQAVGVPALTDTWVRLREEPKPVDLPALWTKLGVALDGDTVRFDDTAPEAAIRKAIAPVP